GLLHKQSPHFDKLSDRLRGLRKNQELKPTQVGFACVDAVSNRPFNVNLTPIITAKALPSQTTFSANLN
ncbi:MAG: hypothetical protein PT116_05845, partial [Aphanizomenon gracile PMC638.10]|nr:hypothetical protein [Aphanizomenon gracile PMC638.10]